MAAMSSLLNCHTKSLLNLYMKSKHLSNIKYLVYDGLVKRRFSHVLTNSCKRRLDRSSPVLFVQRAWRESKRSANFKPKSNFSKSNYRYYRNPDSRYLKQIKVMRELGMINYLWLRYSHINPEEFLLGAYQYYDTISEHISDGHISKLSHIVDENVLKKQLPKLVKFAKKRKTVFRSGQKDVFYSYFLRLRRVYYIDSYEVLVRIPMIFICMKDGGYLWEVHVKRCAALNTGDYAEIQSMKADTDRINIEIENKEPVLLVFERTYDRKKKTFVGCWYVSDIKVNGLTL